MMTEKNKYRGFFDAQTLTFLALIALPILGLVTAVMGFIFILQGHLVAGLIFLLVLTQVFIFGGLWAYTKRKRDMPGKSS